MTAEGATILAAIIVGGVALVGHAWARFAELRGKLADRLVEAAEGLIDAFNVEYRETLRELDDSVASTSTNDAYDSNSHAASRQRAEEGFEAHMTSIRAMFRCASLGFEPFRQESLLFVEVHDVGLNALRKRDESGLQLFEFLDTYVAETTRLAARVRRWGPWLTARLWSLSGRRKRVRKVREVTHPVWLSDIESRDDGYQPDGEANAGGRCMPPAFH